MALSKKQKLAIEEIVNALVESESSPNTEYWTGVAKRAAIGLIPERERSLDPAPYKHRAYPDRSSVFLFSYEFNPRPQYVQDHTRYPQSR